MEIIVHQAILHVLDTTLDAPVLSGSCMEMTAEKTAYLQYHIEKLLASDDIRQCRPLPDSAFRYELEQNKDFIDLSCRIAGVLFDYMHAHTTIPGADLAVVDFTRDGQPWLGILKLNYKNGYTHYTESVDGAPVNSIIQQRACLPPERQGGGRRTGGPDRLLHEAAGEKVRHRRPQGVLPLHRRFPVHHSRAGKKSCRPFRTPPSRLCRRTIRMSPTWRHRWPCSLPIRPLTTTTR